MEDALQEDGHKQSSGPIGLSLAKAEFPSTMELNNRRQRGLRRLNALQ